MTPLANVIMSGRTSGQRSTPNQVPSRPNAQITESIDEQDAVLGAQVRDALDVALGRREHAAGADHRLAEERGDALGPDAQDLLLERGQRVERDRRRVRDERAPVRRVRLDPADRRAERVRAVVAVGAADDVHALRLALQDPVAAGDLGGGVDRVAAAGGEEHLRVVHRRERGEAGGELVRGRVGEVAERRYAARRSICAATARVMSERPWPRLAYQRLAVPSR